jgi:hypothetical protein
MSKSTATYPIADIIGITIDQRDSDTIVKNFLQIFQKVVIDEITGLLEGEVNLAVGGGVIDIYTESRLDFRHIEIVDEIVLWLSK